MSWSALSAWGSALRQLGRCSVDDCAGRGLGDDGANGVVTFRLLNDYGPTSHLAAAQDGGDLIGGLGGLFPSSVRPSLRNFGGCARQSFPVERFPIARTGRWANVRVEIPRMNHLRRIGWISHKADPSWVVQL